MFRSKLGCLAVSAALPALVVVMPAQAATGPSVAGHPGQVVTWGSVRFTVPADWPVYDLRREPTRCLRLDVHAVYLGAANPAPQCPARLIGRTEALHVEPDGVAARSRATLAAAARSSAAGAAGAPALESREEVSRLDGLGVVATASYGQRSELARNILASFGPSGHPAVAADDPAGTAAPAGPPGSVPGARPQPAVPEPPKPLPPSAAPPSARAASIAPGIYTGPGFDACTAPSTSSMSAWLASPFRSIGIYLGGGNRACADGNLSSAWVSAVTRIGWRLAPLYVGYQAPCVTQGGLAEFSTNTSTATTQAVTSARDAVARARHFGLPAGSPIYFDLEGYDTRDSVCRAAVLAFTSGWTAELHRLGFRSGMYSGSASGIRDMAAAIGRPGFAAPDAVWMARWNGVAGVFGDPDVADHYWANHQRLHQYLGGHNETWGGVTINIDSNFDDGPVVTGSAGGGSSGYGHGVVGPGGPGFATSGSWRSGAPQGVRGVMLWTYSSGAVANASATWTPRLSPGWYDVAVFVPSDHAGGHGRYAVTGAKTTTVIINQGGYSDQYVSLGRMATDPGGRLSVRLSNNADPPQAHTVGADAMRFTWAAPLVWGQAWRAPADFTGDRRGDAAVWRASNGSWYIRGARTVRWGVPGDVPVAGNYRGDHRAEPALWRPSDGRWYVHGQRSVRWGQRGDLPLAADFTGDGQVDLAVWRPSTGDWWIRGGGTPRWGIPGDVPVAADYNGDGRAEVAIWRPSNGRWYLPAAPSLAWGLPGDIPIPTRMASRSSADIAVWRPADGRWYVRGGGAVAWGLGGDMAMPTDVTGGGLCDYVTWRPSNGVWYVRGGPAILWGRPGDVPV